MEEGFIHNPQGGREMNMENECQMTEDPTLHPNMFGQSKLPRGKTSETSLFCASIKFQKMPNFLGLLKLLCYITLGAVGVALFTQPHRSEKTDSFL